MAGGAALVLGGGGGTGVAWEIGLLKGLLDARVDLNAAEVVIGTSAGALVGARLRLGHDFDALYREQANPSAPPIAQHPQIDHAVLEDLGQRLMAAPELTLELRQHVARQALAADAGDGEAFVAAIGRQVSESWPDRLLKATGIDVQDGSVVAFDRTSGIPLARAVAISMCVPGMVAPIAANGQRYMDGGIAGNNLGFASGSDVALVIVTNDLPRVQAEADALRASGCQVVFVPPDAASAAALGEGPERFAAERRGPAAEAGRRQAAAVAEQVRAVW